MTVIALPDLRHLTINLRQGDTDLPECWAIPEREYRDGFYAKPSHHLSIVELPATGQRYERQTCSRVVRENANWCRRLGYTYARIDRADYEEDLYRIRASATERQGRAMPKAYLERQSYGTDAPPEPHCTHHLATVHGVIGDDGSLVAYCQVVQCGDIVRVNSILGHADRLRDRCMWLLTLEMFRWHIDMCDARFGLYYTHLSGKGDGLRYWKERFGFRPTKATWVFA